MIATGKGKLFSFFSNICFNGGFFKHFYNLRVVISKKLRYLNPMQIAITKDVKIVVETSYQNSKVKNFSGQHMFAYRITILNQGDYTIKLLRRHWHIVDLIGGKSEVEGEGVVGLQPVLEPGESHQYVSGCSLVAEIGKMYGTYLMERQIDGELFEVKIPEFTLGVPFIFN